MAQGTGTLFNDYVLKSRKGLYSVTDDLFIAFVSDTIASIDFDATNPKLTDVTVVSGGNVAASYALANPTITRVSGDVPLKADNIAKILKDALNPDDIRCLVVYNGTSVDDDLIQAHDLTTDGTTPIDIDTQDFQFTFGVAGVNVATV